VSEQKEGSRSEQVAEDLLEGKLSCDDCPDLKKMVESVRNNEMGKEEFEQIIDYHLKMNEQKYKLNNVIL
jgi:hypothetical protein